MLNTDIHPIISLDELNKIISAYINTQLTITDDNSAYKNNHLMITFELMKLQSASREFFNNYNKILKQFDDSQNPNIQNIKLDYFNFLRSYYLFRSKLIVALISILQDHSAYINPSEMHFVYDVPDQAIIYHGSKDSALAVLEQTSGNCLVFPSIQINADDAFYAAFLQYVLTIIDSGIYKPF